MLSGGSPAFSLSTLTRRSTSPAKEENSAPPVTVAFLVVVVVEREGRVGAGRREVADEVADEVVAGREGFGVLVEGEEEPDLSTDEVVC